MHAPQLGEGLGGLAQLLLQMRDLLDALLARELERLRRTLALLGRDHLRDLGDGEAELAALEDERDVVLVGRRVDAAAALARRLEQALALVETQRARRHAELFRHLADRHGIALTNRRRRLRVDPDHVGSGGGIGRYKKRFHLASPISCSGLSGGPSSRGPWVSDLTIFRPVAKKHSVRVG